MKHILLVDDSVANLKIANAALEPFYKVSMLTSGAQLLKFLSKNTPDLILLDIEMPVLDGFSVLEKLEESGIKNVAPIIFLTSIINSDLEARAFSAGVVDFINKPFATMPLLSRVKMHLDISEYRKNLENLVDEKTKTIEELQDVLSLSIAKLVGCRDGYTGEHVMRTHTYLKILLEQMLRDKTYEQQLTPQLCKDMLRGAALHDIGKVGIQDEILCKRGKFSEDEFELIEDAHHFGRADPSGRYQRQHGGELPLCGAGHGAIPSREMGRQRLCFSTVGPGYPAVRANHGCGRCLRRPHLPATL